MTDREPAVGREEMSPGLRRDLDALLDGVATAIARELTQRQREQLVWLAQTDVCDVYDTRTLDRLARRGFVESYEDAQIGTCWRITDAGRAVLSGAGTGGAAPPSTPGGGEAGEGRDGTREGEPT